MAIMVDFICQSHTLAPQLILLLLLTLLLGIARKSWDDLGRMMVDRDMRKERSLFPALKPKNI